MIRPDPSQPAMVPTLAEIEADPKCLDGLPVDALLRLRYQARCVDSAIDIVITRLLIRSHEPTSPAESDRLLSPGEAATVFNVKTRWLLEHADEIPGVRRLSRKTIRFSERRLRRYLEGTRA